MIVGILEADALAEEVVQRFGSYAHMFEKLLSAADTQLTFRSYRVTEQEYPQNINDCDAYLITGSKSSCYENINWIEQLKQFSVDCLNQEKKLIGICFGHQLVAQALGGSVQKSDKGWWIGVTGNDVTQTPHWLIPEKQHFNLLVSHQDQVTQMPAQATLLARNDFCPIAAYQVNESILTFQGHPEFSYDYLQYIMTKRREIIGEEVYQQALTSLQKSIDHDVVAKWITRFISNPVISK